MSHPYKSRKPKGEKKEKKVKPPMELATDAVASYFNERYRTFAFSRELRVAFINNPNQKVMIKIGKTNDAYRLLTEKDLIVTVNEDLFDKMDNDMSKEILFNSEINKIHINNNTGAIKFKRPNLVIDTEIVSKYGAESVLRANELTELATSQVKEDNAIVESMFGN